MYSTSKYSFRLKAQVSPQSWLSKRPTNQEPEIGGTVYYWVVFGTMPSDLSFVMHFLHTSHKQFHLRTTTGMIESCDNGIGSVRMRI